MQELLAIVYPDPTAAHRASEEFVRCETELNIDREATSVIVCNRDASCELTTLQRENSASQWGRFWSMILGVVMGGDDPYGIDSRFKSTLQSSLLPGTSAFLIALPATKSHLAIDALGALGGDIMRCDMHLLW